MHSPTSREDVHMSPKRMRSHGFYEDVQTIDSTASQTIAGCARSPLVFGMHALRTQAAQQIENRLPGNQPLVEMSCKSILEGQELTGTRFKVEGWITHCDRTAVQSGCNQRSSLYQKDTLMTPTLK